MGNSTLVAARAAFIKGERRTPLVRLRPAAARRKQKNWRRMSGVARAGQFGNYYQKSGAPQRRTTGEGNLAEADRVPVDKWSVLTAMGFASRGAPRGRAQAGEPTGDHREREGPVTIAQVPG